MIGGKRGVRRADRQLNRSTADVSYIRSIFVSVNDSANIADIVD